MTLDNDSAHVQHRYSTFQRKNGTPKNGSDDNAYKGMGTSDSLFDSSFCEDGQR